MDVWSPRTVLDPVLSLAPSLMEPPPCTETCLTREQCVFQENLVCHCLCLGSPGGQWAPALPLGDPPEGARGWRLSDIRSGGSRRLCQVHMAAGLRARVSGKDLGFCLPRNPQAQYEVRRTCMAMRERPYSRILNRLLQGTPNLFVCKCLMGTWNPGHPEDTVSWWTWSEVRKELRFTGTMCGSWWESVLETGMLDHWAGGGQCGFWACGLIEALRSSTGAWTLQVPRHCTCLPAASSCVRPWGWFSVQGELRRETIESEKERWISCDIDHMWNLK